MAPGRRASPPLPRTGCSSPWPVLPSVWPRSSAPTRAEGISHIQLWLEPNTLESLEAFAPVLELLDRSSLIPHGVAAPSGGRRARYNAGMHRVAVRGVALTAAIAALAAPADPQTLPPAATDAPTTGAPAGWTRSTLPNGVVVLVAERPGIPIVIVRVAVDAGAVLDPPDRAGVANLTALLLTRGSTARTALEADRAIEFVGGSLEGEGGRDASELTLSVLRKDLSLGLDLLADALRRPVFPDAEFERKRDEVRASVQRSEEDPGAVAARALRRLVFPGHPYSRPVDGNRGVARRHHAGGRRGLPPGRLPARTHDRRGGRRRHRGGGAGGARRAAGRLVRDGRRPDRSGAGGARGCRRGPRRSSGP